MTQFKRHLSAKLTQLEPAPISAEIIVQRFHVVVKYAVPNRPETDSKTIEFKVDDDCDTTTDDLFAESEYHDAKAKWAESDRKARAEHRKSPPEPRLRDFASGDTHEDPFDDVERQITTLLFKAVLIDLPVAIVTSAYDATKQYAYRGSPPEWASVPPGVTCEIEAQIELKWADGRQTTISLKTRQTEPYAIAPDGRKDEVAPFQAEVILQSVDNVAHQAAEFLRSEVAHESNGKEDL